ncbi:hypothetical protein ACFWZ2_39700 [Streptomyces sp. NPDC059002]|uniref:hypothetical protein n=1 Tax=Streptomyces sp. NPDC059002 TaxID=3346690 RepID=UPI00369461B5
MHWARRSAAILIAAFLLASCGSRDETDSPPPSRDDFNQAIARAKDGLFRGTLTYNTAEQLKLRVDESTVFRTTISGTRRKNARGADVPVSVGAQMGVKLHCSGAGIRCTPLSSERQSMTTPSDVTEWRWRLTPASAGTAHLDLTATAYFHDTEMVLAEKAPPSMAVEVSPPTSHAAATVKKYATMIGTSGLVVLAAVGGVPGAVQLRELWQGRARRRTAAGRATDGTRGRDTGSGADPTRGGARDPEADGGGEGGGGEE